MIEKHNKELENWGLVGHAWAVERLRRHIQEDSISHAYLFTGAPGTGRRTLALRFMQGLVCEAPPAPAEPCGGCRSCRQVAAMQYADLTVVQSEQGSKVIKVEQVREACRLLPLSPIQSRYRLALFLRFQDANPSAANALLKSLEEPPPHAFIILTADTAEQLLPTVVSRCEVLALRPAPLEELAAALQGRGVEASKALLLAHLSSGRAGAALRLAENDAELDFRRSRLLEMLDLLAASRSARFDYAARMAEKKHESSERPGDTLLYWISFWRDVLVLAAGVKSALVNIDLQPQAEALAHRVGLEGSRRAVAGLEKALERIEKNVNLRLLLEVTLLDLPGAG